jgi:hypothetical protein
VIRLSCMRQSLSSLPRRIRIKLSG